MDVIMASTPLAPRPHASTFGCIFPPLSVEVNNGWTPTKHRHEWCLSEKTSVEVIIAGCCHMENLMTRPESYRPSKFMLEVL